MLVLNNLLTYKNTKLLYLWCGFIISELAFILISLHLNLSSIVILIIALSILLFFFLIESKSLTIVFILSLLLTEFYWIEVLRGFLKPFHILAVFLFLTYTFFYIKYVLRSKIVWLIVLFVVTNLIAIIFSQDKIDSLRSLSLPLILISIALNVSIILYTNKISTRLIQNIILYGTLVAIFFGFVQMFAHTLFGFSLSLTNAQISQITIAKRPPSFFTEADTFGKFLSLPFFLFLPFALQSNKQISKFFRIFILVVLFAIIFNMTRSAMIGISITLILYAIYYLRHKYFTRTLAILMGGIAIILVFLPIMLTMLRVVGSNDEFSYRMQTLINPPILLSDGSTHFRRIAIEETFRGVMASSLTFSFGHGWGQSYIYIWNMPHDVGGNLLLNILYYSGFFSLLIFILICYRIISIFYKIAKQRNDGNVHLFAEGLLFSFICMLIISQLSSMWIAPEFWIVVGYAIFFELWLRKAGLDTFFY